MKYVKGELYATTKFTDATVVFFEDTDKEVEIYCTIHEQWDENTGWEGFNVYVDNTEDIPEGYTEEQVIDFVKENFNN
jgi:hypothetical protein